jgi:nucleoside-diphosphate-sugar epimerase
VLLGDPGRLAADPGWEPRIPLDDTLADLLEDMRDRLSGTD